MSTKNERNEEKKLDLKRVEGYSPTQLAEELKKKRVANFATRFLCLKKSQIKGGKSKKMVGFGNNSVSLHQN